MKLTFTKTSAIVAMMALGVASLSALIAVEGTRTVIEFM